MSRKLLTGRVINFSYNILVLRSIVRIDTIRTLFLGGYMKSKINGNVIMTFLATLVFSSFTFAGQTDQTSVEAPLPALLFEPDHYLSYDIKAGPHRAVIVTLQDQFLGPVPFVVNKPIKLLNPALKRHNNTVIDIKYPRLHYTVYDIRLLEEISINADVLVFNQFGQFSLNEFRPSRLLAPTRKILQSSTTNPSDDTAPNQSLKADHYLCYDVPPQTVNVDLVYLKDQFRSRGLQNQNLVVTRLCNPVAKRHDDKFFEILHNVETNHLLCFDIPNKEIFKIGSLIDQFGNKAAIALNDDEFCVPSVKIKLTSDQCEGSLPDFENQCNGLCPNPTDVCLPDPISQLCRCSDTIPTQCADTVPDSDGQCNGECPDNQICIADLTNDSCQCQEITFPCGLGEDGQCGGACPTGETCIALPGTIECECVSFN